MCKLLLIFALLPVIVLAGREIITEPIVNVCQGQADGVFLANNRGCAWFNRCAGQLSIEGRCPPDFVFNPTNSKCDYPDSFECTIKKVEIDMACIGSGLRLLPNLYSCSQYTFCFDG